MPHIALVTGTSSGVGLSAAVLLARAGFHVIATMRDLNKAEPLKARVSAAGVHLEVRQLDVQDQASIDACVGDILATYGAVDLLVNNAGVGFLGSIEQTSAEDLARLMDINFLGVWRMTQAVFPAMRERRAGRIITVTSIGGVIGQPFNDAYCAAKFAAEGLMESLAPTARKLGYGTDKHLAVKVATRKRPALRYTTSRQVQLIVRALLAAKLWSAR